VQDAGDEYKQVEDLDDRRVVMTEQRHYLEAAARNAKEAGSRAAEARDIAENAVVLASKAGRAGRAYKQTCQLRGLLDAVSRADAARRVPVPDLGSLETATRSAVELQIKSRDLRAAVRDCRNRRAVLVVSGNTVLGTFEELIDRIEKQIAAVEATIEVVQERGWQKKTARDEWKTAHDNLHSTTDVCPTCGQEIHDA
jgi:DNA repair exonuclease SbcCD ATPase subunit